ncbi:MAG TPA: molecular chaperone DnaJ [Dehalococcoidia bacterium]|nr:molecular chaperone DnaJ [Chloroflexota bacterium]MQF94455.1 molecular chaperone DnaJ [SAR202 cluster bacterium]HAA94967.1 molecular chaperone DnaJ [Dehalococcoidia bacterium]HCL26434.1 molecular chaperone DnaJ [Dehalococcoidia bacterium]
MADNDYYDLLGVSRGVGDEDIRKAFRRKAMEFHPDRNKSPDAEEKFKEINEAYQVLSDANKRAQYDQFGKAGVGANGGAGQPFDGFDVFGGFGDIFDSFFGDGTGRRARQAQRGSDLQQRVVLNFEEAVFGAEREVEVTRLENCSVCSGAGNEPGTPLDTCNTCKGNGQVRRAQRSVFGQFTQVTTCTSCQGRGTIIKTVCSNCRGGGKERKSRKIAVNIPAGVESGIQVRLTGEGDAGSEGGGPGNLYVYLDVQEHQFFHREGSDLIYELPINIAEAALGVDKSIPTLDGDDEELSLPQGTQPGSEFRIRGKGVPHLNGSRRGDLRVSVDVRVPGSLDDRQRELLEELADSFGTPTGDGGDDKGLFDKIKEALG